MTANKKIAQKRLTLLQLAEQLRKVSEACRHHGGGCQVKCVTDFHTGSRSPDKIAN